ncbi:pentapeptide repeat-containing protein [Phenylobacterium sp.]|uniref:pentapeptide repeat-containing protein n=1 Tax=Phenylobacterium sp. TaxID=1871053 RepID=UPI002FDA7D32
MSSAGSPRSALAFAPILALVLSVTVGSTAAQAQNAGQIAQVRQGAHCPKCNLFQADLGGRELRGRNLSGARLRQADLSLAIMNRSNFAGADLRDVEAYGALFASASFAGADLSQASFVGTHLQGANFRGARLAGTNFSGAEMDRATGLTQAQLSQACGDASTRLPPGLRIPAC